MSLTHSITIITLEMTFFLLKLNTYDQIDTTILKIGKSFYKYILKVTHSLCHEN